MGQRPFSFGSLPLLFHHVLKQRFRIMVNFVVFSVMMGVDVDRSLLFLEHDDCKLRASRYTALEVDP